MVSTGMRASFCHGDGLATRSTKSTRMSLPRMTRITRMRTLKRSVVFYPRNPCDPRQKLCRPLLVLFVLFVAIPSSHNESKCLPYEYCDVVCDCRLPAPAQRRERPQRLE